MSVTPYNGTIFQMVVEIQNELDKTQEDLRNAKADLKAIADAAEAENRTRLTSDEEKIYRARAGEVDKLRAASLRIQRKLDDARKAADEEREADAASREIIPVEPKKRAIKYDQVVRVTGEPRTYAKESDPQGRQFLTDVLRAYRGEPTANERLSRHMREYEIDNKSQQTRAAGDVPTSALPNLVIPSYLVSEYAAKPSAARPFADLCRHIDLPPEGMKVEIAKGNTTSTAALQTSELVAPSGGNFDVDPLELSVQTAEAWQLVSRQAIDRGRVTEQVVLDDMLDQMHALIDSTLITQSTTGLFDASTRITYDSASPTVTEMYPFILQGASKISQALLNRGKPTHVVMHPRRWYWMESIVGSTWPMISAPGIDPRSFGQASAAGYDQGIAGVLPCGLKVVLDANVQTAALGAAQTGGTQDIAYVIPQNEAILLEAPNREVFIRAEAPAANQLGVMLVVYEYFAYTFQRYAATAFQKINGTGTVAPTGF